MKSITTIVLSIVLLTSCQEDEVLLQDYLSDSGVEANVSGTVGDYVLKEQYAMKLYEEYRNQSIIYPRGGGYTSMIHRFSEDFQSTMTFTIVLDSAYNLSEARTFCLYRLTKVEDNKILIIDNKRSMSVPQIDQLNYNQDTGNLTFNYELTVDNLNQFYTIEGKVDVVVYQYSL